MTWKNAFADGPCKVTVTQDNLYEPGPTVGYSGDMAVGDSASFPDSGLPEETLTIAVDSAGRVTLSGTRDYYGSGSVFDVSVAVSSATSARLSDVATDNGGDVSATADGAEAASLNDQGSQYRAPNPYAFNPVPSESMGTKITYAGA